MYALCFIIAVYGLSTVMVFGSGPFKILEKIRTWAYAISPHFGQLFSCMLCFPTNLGIALSLISWFMSPVMFTPFTAFFEGYDTMWWIAVLFDGGLAAGATWFIHNVLELFISGVEEHSEDERDLEPAEDDVIEAEDITNA